MTTQDKLLPAVIPFPADISEEIKNGKQEEKLDVNIQTVAVPEEILSDPDMWMPQLLKKIEKYQYKKIYVYSNFWQDNPLDKKDVNKVRELLIKFSKESEITIIFNFSDIHLPVDKSITNAISWFFTHEEEGIILEDDIGINSVSLEFISKGLEIYRDSNNIASVSAFTEYKDYEKNYCLLWTTVCIL